MWVILYTLNEDCWALCRPFHNWIQSNEFRFYTFGGSGAPQRVWLPLLPELFVCTHTTRKSLKSTTRQGHCLKRVSNISNFPQTQEHTHLGGLPEPQTYNFLQIHLFNLSLPSVPFLSGSRRLVPSCPIGHKSHSTRGEGQFVSCMHE